MSLKFLVVFFKNFFYLSVVSISLNAVISPGAFYGIHENIHKNYQYLNPLWGQLALESGIINKLRFKGNFKAAYKNGNRNYIKDSSDDATWMLIKLLFPSPTGILASNTSGEYNFGNFVKSPHIVALLLQYTHSMRHNKSVQRNSILPMVGASRVNSRYLLKTIERSVQQEKDKYSPHFTEVVILAFFAHHFNEQFEIWQLLYDLDKLLDENIVISFPFSYEYNNKNSYKEVLLDKENAQLLNYNIKNPELLYNFLHFYSYFTPYYDGNPLMEFSSNSIRGFDRKKNLFDENISFMDCAEFTIKHTLNLLLYDHESKSFNLDKFDNLLSENIINLKNFFIIQPANKANNSTKEIGEEFNKVISHMNKENDPIKVQYLKSGNEIAVSFDNFITILAKIFSVKLPERNNVIVTQWLEQSFDKVFTAINGNYKYFFKLNITEQDGKLYGEVAVDVYQNEEVIFSFIIRQLLMFGHFHACLELTYQKFIGSIVLEDFVHMIDHFTEPHEQSLLLLYNKISDFAPYSEY